MVVCDNELTSCGVRCFGFCASPFNNPAEVVLQAQEDGWDYVEIYWEPPLVSVDEPSLSNIRDAVSSSGTPIILHIDAMLTSFSPYPLVREAKVFEVQRCLRFASETGASIVGIHIDGMNRLRRKLHGNRTIINFCYQTWLSMIRQLIDMASSYDIKLVGENGPFSDNEVLTQIFRHLPELKLLLDVGHTNLRKTSNFNLEGFIKQMPDRIGHVHVHDNKGIYDEHLPVGYGTIDWGKVVRQLLSVGYVGTISIEVQTMPKEPIRSREKLKKAFEGHFPEPTSNFLSRIFSRVVGRR